MTAERSKEEIQLKTKRVRERLADKRANAKSQPVTLKCPGWIDSYYQCPKCQSKNVYRTEHKRFACRSCHAMEVQFPLRYEINEDRKKIVQQIFASCIKGIGTPRIASELNQKRVPPFGKAKGGWHQSTIQKILTARTTIGEYQPHTFPDGVKRSKRQKDGEAIKDYYPRVIDEPLFYRAQQAIEQRRIQNKNGKLIGRGGRRGTNFANLFLGGICRCAYCNSTMRYINKGAKNHAYLVCSSSLRGLGCEKTHWRYADFESSFIELVRELDLGAITNGESLETKRATLQNVIDACEGKIASLEQDREEAFKLLKTDPEFVGKKLKEFKAQIEAEQQKQQEAQQSLSTLELVPMSVEEARALARRLQEKDEDVYRLRAQIASKIQSLASEIVVASAGLAPLLTRKNVIVENEEKYNPDDARAKHRWFGVRFKTGQKIRFVAPSATDPRAFMTGSEFLPFIPFEEKDKLQIVH